LVHRLLTLRRLVDCLERTSRVRQAQAGAQGNRHEEIGKRAMAALNRYG